jgi:malonyl-CoA O-methyltransferase
MSDIKRHVAQRFAAAADDYDAHSSLQRTAAQRLAQRVTALALPASPRVLEIGCGTGHLTEILAPHIGGDWLITDIAPAMVAACRKKLVRPARFAVMDGERPAFAAGQFDLIVSSLAAQWFDDLPAALAALSKLLAPGGHLALTTLGEGSFAEWRTAHASCGFSPAVRDYPTAATLRSWMPSDCSGTVSAEILTEVLAGAIEFPRRLRAIGADTPAPGRRPLTAGGLRRVLAALEETGATGMSYALLHLVARRMPD